MGGATKRRRRTFLARSPLPLAVAPHANRGRSTGCAPRLPRKYLFCTTRQPLAGSANNYFPECVPPQHSPTTERDDGPTSQLTFQQGALNEVCAQRRPPLRGTTKSGCSCSLLRGRERGSSTRSGPLSFCPRSRALRQTHHTDSAPMVCAAASITRPRVLPHLPALAAPNPTSQQSAETVCLAYRLNLLAARGRAAFSHLPPPPTSCPPIKGGASASHPSSKLLLSLQPQLWRRCTRCCCSPPSWRAPPARPSPPAPHQQPVHRVLSAPPPFSACRSSAGRACACATRARDATPSSRR